MQHAIVHDPFGRTQKTHPGRTNSYAGFALIDADLVAPMLRERLAAAAGVDAMAMEPPQVLHYAVGEQYAPHFDFLEPDFPGDAQAIQEHGQRIPLEW